MNAARGSNKCLRERDFRQVAEKQGGQSLSGTFGVLSVSGGLELFEGECQPVEKALAG